MKKLDITIKNLNMTFDSKKVIDDISITINSGELVSFLGPSGCGKTTTLKIISGILNQDSGDIFFQDQPMKNVPTQDRKIGMVFQNYALYPHMTVYENLAFPLKMKKMNKVSIKENVFEIAEFLEIKHLLNNKPGQLSGGEQQRVAIGRAIIKKPNVLLMDEPLSNLDKNLRIKMRDEIKKIQKQLGITTIFVTHDQEEAFSISDTIFLMNGGKIEQYGKPEELYYNPKTLFVARFIGNTPLNEIKASIMNGVLSLKGIDASYKIDLEDNEEVYVIIRANEIEMCDRKERDFCGFIKTVEFRDPNYLVTLENEDLELKVFIPSSEKIKEGEEINLRIFPNKLKLFDSSLERL